MAVTLPQASTNSPVRVGAVCASGSASCGEHPVLSVTFFSTARVWGGAEEQTRLLARGLARRGHTCRFVVRRDSPVAERVGRDGFPVLTVFGSGRSPASLTEVRRHLRTTRPDVIHFVDPHAVTCGGLASLGLGIPARIAVRHNSFPIRSTLRYRWLCDRLICVCQAVAGVCRDSGVPDRMLRVVNNGCEITPDTHLDRSVVRAQLGVAERDFLALTVAHLNSCKGHAYLLDAMPLIAKEFPNIRLLLAGSGPLENQLRSQARQTGVDGMVRFLGFRDDVPGLLKAVDLFVLPSLAEGLSAVLLEAASAGCPVVSTTVGGAEELFAARHTQGQPSAWLVPPANAGALAHAMIEAIGANHERQTRAARAKERVPFVFSVKELVSNTLAVYREVMVQNVDASERHVS